MNIWFCHSVTPTTVPRWSQNLFKYLNIHYCSNTLNNCNFFYYPWLIKNRKMNTKWMNLQLHRHKRYKKDTERSAGVWWNSGRREEYWLRTDFNLNSLSEIIKIHTWCQMQFSISSPGPSSLQGWGETGASHVHTSTKLRSNKNKCAVHF